MHRLGFVLKRPKKRLLKANAEKRAAFVAAYVILRAEAQAQGAKICFVDEAHFRADVELRAKWVLRGEPALVDSSSPRLGEKATYYSAVCLETGEVEAMIVLGNTTAATSVTFLQQLREQHVEPLIVIWDNGPAHHGPEMREYLTTPELKLRLVALPGYSPDFNPDEAIWDWIREEVTANLCFGTVAKVREKVDAFFATLADRTAEVKQWCRRAAIPNMAGSWERHNEIDTFQALLWESRLPTRHLWTLKWDTRICRQVKFGVAGRRELQAQADALVDAAREVCAETNHVDLTLRSV